MVPEGDLLEDVKPGPDGKIDVLTVFAHPDDEVIYGGGTMIKIKKDPRVRIHILCLGQGNWEDQAREVGIATEQLVKIRDGELKNAAFVLQAEQVIHWSIPDGGFVPLDRENLIRDVLQVIEQVGAEIVITHDPAGITRNSDHITTSKVATAAFRRSSAQRLYYPTLPQPIYSVAMYLEREEWQGEPVVPSEPTFDLSIKEEKVLKRMACYEHASQMFFSNVGPVTKILLLFPREYWTLAESLGSELKF